MGIIARIRKDLPQLQAIDGHGFAGKVFAWLVNAGATGRPAMRARIEDQDRLRPVDKADLDDLFTTYQARPNAISKLEFAITVKCVLEMAQDHYRVDDEDKRTGYKNTRNELRAFIELDPI